MRASQWAKRGGSMKVFRLLLCAAVAAALATTLVAQQPTSTTGFHTVACFKVKPGSGDDFHKFVTEDSHKVSQGRVDNGEITTWYLLRSVLPQGASAECDYLIVTMFPGAPHLLNQDVLTAALKKAGLSISAKDYLNRRDAVTTLVSVAVFQNLSFVGAAKKGDYFRVNYMKVPNVDDWVAYENKVWKPFAEALQKDGLLDGWSINAQVLPGGADLPYQAVTVDVFPSFNAIFADDPKFVERFRNVHPDREIGTTFEQFGKLRTIESIKVFELEDFITAAK
jgi:hypothetical protein